VRRRRGFTIVELLVAMALILFIMVILTEAFTAGLEAFRQLKAVGDMQERLRTTAALLRRDLSADHFEGNRRLGDKAFWREGPPGLGFFRIFQGDASIREGTDAVLDVPGSLGSVYYLGATRATSHALHFSVRLRGNGREDFFSASIPGSPLLLRDPNGPGAQNPTTFFNQPDEARYQDSGTTYNGQWAEVAYFLAPNGTTAGNTPLYALYRSQFVAVPDNARANALNLSLAQHYEMSCALSNGALYFNTPQDLANPARRAFTARGVFDRANPAGWAASLLLTDVVSFDVRVLRYFPTDSQNTPAYTDPSFVDLPGTPPTSFDTAGPPALDPNPLFPQSPYNIVALEISLRIWDLRTQKTRQITLVQDM
jgi:prepilin-type N-terminal cleavage/methylation domain-containing protein